MKDASKVLVFESTIFLTFQAVIIAMLGTSAGDTQKGHLLSESPGSDIRCRGLKFLCSNLEVLNCELQKG